MMARRYFLHWRDLCTGRGLLRSVVAVISMLVLIVLFLTRDSVAPTGTQAPPVFGALIICLAVVICVAQVLSRCAKHFGQPEVIGEMFAGLLLGPSVFGRVAPSLSQEIFSPTVIPHLDSIAELGVLIYLFMLGLELDIGDIWEQGGSATIISLSSVFIPFMAGLGISLVMFPGFAGDDTSLVTFSLFLGVALSVTAFPVLARILGDLNLLGTRLGAMALSCAAIADLLAWCMLSIVISVSQSRLSNVAPVCLGNALFVIVMLSVVSPAVRGAVSRINSPSRVGTFVPVAIGAMFVAAFTAQALGSHALFGAFIFGLLIPRRSSLARELSRQLQGVVMLVLLPVFFVTYGLRTDVGLLSNADNVGYLILIISVAVLSKLCSTTMAAFVSGAGPRDALALGVLMNARGLMELVVIEIGRDLQVISPALFTMLVLMTLVTTFAAAPLFTVLSRGTQTMSNTADSGDVSVSSIPRPMTGLVE